jgi:hypothetical protein
MIKGAGVVARASGGWGDFAVVRLPFNPSRYSEVSRSKTSSD